MPGLTRGLSIKWILKTQGRVGFARWALRSIPYHLWLHLTPQGRRDLNFDSRHSVVTEGITWPEAQCAVHYAPVQPYRFRHALAQLPVDFPRFTFMDVGCGKGRPLIMAKEYSFRRILGVEVSETLVGIAGQNAPHAEVVCANALAFEFPPEDSVIYMFNPFRDPVMGAFIARLEESLMLLPRAVWIVYQSPFFSRALDASPMFTRTHLEPGRLAVYRSRSNP